MELVLGREDVMEAVVEGAVDEDVAAVVVADDGMVWGLVWGLLLVLLNDVNFLLSLLLHYYYQIQINLVIW